MKKSEKICPSCGAKNKKPFFKRWWFILFVIIVVVGIVSSMGNKDEKQKPKTIDWDNLVMGEMIPRFQSNKGEITVNSSSLLMIRFTEVSQNQYDEYISECEKMGYTIEAEQDSFGYDAYNTDGYKISLLYFDSSEELTITLNSPEEEDETEETIKETEEKTEAPTPEETTTEKETEENNDSELVDGMRKEFKESMDQYEEFMDEYCEFMEKYANSNGTDISMLADYAKYLAKYSEMMKSFEEWEDGELNDAELNYYLEVQTRVTQKLLETGVE